MRIPLNGGVAASILLSTLLSACGGGGGSASPLSVPTTQTMSLVMTQPWTDTSVSVTAGQRANVVASGTMHYISGQGEYCNLGVGKCVATPSGLPWTACSNDPAPAFTAPGLRCWSLIGKVGASGSPFEIGNSSQIIVPASGELYLGVNDNDYTDNTGSWSATITINQN